MRSDPTIRFHRSAARHAISQDRVRHVVGSCGCPLYPADPEEGEQDRVMFLGPDQRGVPLEVVAVETEDGDLMVIHAMRLRARYASLYAWVMECRE